MLSGIRHGGLSVEDVVGGELGEAGSCAGGATGDVGGSDGVDGEGFPLMALGIVHSRPGRAVDDEVVPGRCGDALTGIGDVEVDPTQRGDHMAGGAEGGNQVVGEHARRAGDEDAEGAAHRPRRA